MDQSLLPPVASLPPDYQNQIDQLQRRQAIAQMLQQRALTLQAPPQGPVASRISPFSGIADALTGGIGGYMGNTAMTDINNVKQKFSTDQLNAIKQMQGLPQDDAIKFGQASQFPLVQQLASTLYKNQQANQQKIGGFLSDAGDTAGAIAAVNNGTIPTAIPAPKAPSVQMVDAGDGTGRKIPMVINYGIHGTQTGNLASGTTVNLPGKEGELSLSREQQDLAARQTAAQNAQANLATAQQLTQAIQEGAAMGGGSDVKQVARKIGQAFGIDLPETGPTDTAKQLLGERVLDRAKTLGSNPSDADREAIKAIVGTLDTDPTAATKLVAFVTGKSLKTLQDFQDFVQAKKNSPATKLYPGLYDTADIGIRPPDALFGNPDQQFKTIEALKQYGGDITRFKDPTGKAFPADSSFNIQVSPMGPKAAPAPKFQEGAVYTDKNGNKAKYVNGQWVPQ